MYKRQVISLCESRGVKIGTLERQANLSNGTLNKWTDETIPNGYTLQAIADYFDVSVDYLLGREDSPVNAQFASDAPAALTPRDNRDIARDMAAIEASLESGEGLMFNGEPLSPEAKESLLAAMRLGLEAAKLKNKERLTPKKYRKD